MTDADRTHQAQLAATSKDTLHRDWCPSGPDCVSSLCEFRRDVERVQEAQLADMPLETILAYLRSRGFVVGESWVWRGVDALPPGYPPRAEDDEPFEVGP